MWTSASPVRERVEEAVEFARAQRKPTGQILVEQGILRHDQLARVVADRYGLDYIDLSVYELDMGAVNLIDMEAIRRYQAVPVGFLEDGTLLLAMADPTNVLTVDDIAMLTGQTCALGLGVDRGPQHPDHPSLPGGAARSKRSSKTNPSRRPNSLMDEADKDAPVIKLVHSIIAEAIDQGASDIHIDPVRATCACCCASTACWRPTATLKRAMAASIISRVKIMSEMDISERRVPQDGRFALTVNGRRVDVRVDDTAAGIRRGRLPAHPRQGRHRARLESLGMQRTEQDLFAHASRDPTARCS